jgi:hypothetical protein
MDDLYRFGEERIAAFARQVSVVRDPTLDMRMSRIRVRLADGSVLEERVDTTVGQPTIAEITDFCGELAHETGVDAAIFSAMAQAVQELDRAADVGRLIATVAAGTRRAR